MEFFAMLYAALSFLWKKTHHDHVHHVHCTVVHYGRHALEVAWLSRTGRGCVNFSCELTDGRTNKGIPRGPHSSVSTPHGPKKIFMGVKTFQWVVSMHHRWWQSQSTSSSFNWAAAFETVFLKHPEKKKCFASYFLLYPHRSSLP